MATMVSPIAPSAGDARAPAPQGGSLGLFWVPHDKSVWAPCRLQNIAGATAALSTLLEGEVVTCPAEKLQGMAQVHEQQLQGVDDICSLSTVNDAALLHTIRVRYAQQLIYTRVSRILISLNPFTPLPIYSLDKLHQYASAADSVDLAPHIFGTGHDAMRGLQQGTKDQAIVISGESGAGKTESAKLLLRYVAEVVSGGSKGVSGVEKQVMQTNPVLEAFGNAMTVRNNNSSRFGKWLDMRFSEGLSMLGCQITSYLLEVTRVCSQADGERGYHIFFQLLQAKDTPFLSSIALGDLSQYRYLRNSLPVAPGINDALCFQETRDAMAMLGFNDAEQLGIFRIVAGVITLGNVEFRVAGQDELLFEDSGAVAVARAAALLGIDGQALARCMLWRKVVTGRDVTVTPLREDQARAVRDGLSRMLYGNLFEWLIERMNDRLHASEDANSAVDGAESSPNESGIDASSAARGTHRLLGILDISGFESFERNSLEQLLINLSNEHLQLQFNDDVFRAELEDCSKEGISLQEAINYADNSDVVSLLDGRGGVLDMLDEEITMPKATDMTFSAKVVRGLTKHSRLIPPKFSGLPVFGVHHFAGNVHYTCDGFLEKNADRLPSDDAVDLLSASSLQAMRAVGQVLQHKISGGSAIAPQKGKRSKSAISRFRTSLKALMGKIGAADNHYIRCIKPNVEKAPAHFTAPMVHEQLLFSGVLEAVRIRQQGYSSRLPYASFTLRYRCVLAVSVPGVFRAQKVRSAGLDTAERTVAQEFVKQLLAAYSAQLSDFEFAFGTTKLFMKATAMGVLEAARARAGSAAIIHIQRVMRAARVRKKLKQFLPLLRRIRCWLHSWCPDEVWHKGILTSPLLQRLQTYEAAHRELGIISPLLHSAAEINMSFGIVHRAGVAQQRLLLEVTALSEVRRLVQSRCVDVPALDAALLRIHELGLPNNDDIASIGSWAQRVKQQLPLVAGLQDIKKSGDLTSLPRLMFAIEQAGLVANPETWIAELQGADLLNAVQRMVEVDRAITRVKSLLNSGSVDLTGMGEALSRARQLGVESHDECSALQARMERVQTQLPLVRALREVFNSRAVGQVPHVMRDIEQAGLHKGSDMWIRELEGDQLMSDVERMLRDEETRKQRQAEEEAAAARDFRRPQESASNGAQIATAAGGSAMAGGGTESQNHHVSAGSERQLGMSSRNAPAEVAPSPHEFDCSNMRQLAARLENAVARIRGVQLGKDLFEIAKQLQGECENGCVPETFVGLAKSLTTQSARIRGTPLGDELDQIVRALATEIRQLEESQSSSNGAAPQYSPVVDTSGWSVSDLRACVARLMEERDELRHALQGALLEAVQREEALRVECESLRAKKGKASNEYDDSTFAIALEEEARAAREARSDLMDEIARLKSDLTTEQATSRALRAELAAVRALKGTGARRPDRRQVDEQSSETPAALPEVSLRPEASGDASAGAESVATPPEQQTAQPSVQNDPNILVPDAFVSKFGGGSSSRRNGASADDAALARPRRGYEFTERDFNSKSNGYASAMTSDPVLLRLLNEAAEHAEASKAAAELCASSPGTAGSQRFSAASVLPASSPTHPQQDPARASGSAHVVDVAAAAPHLDSISGAMVVDPGCVGHQGASDAGRQCAQLDVPPAGAQFGDPCVSSQATPSPAAVPGATGIAADNKSVGYGVAMTTAPASSFESGQAKYQGVQRSDGFLEV